MTMSKRTLDNADDSLMRLIDAMDKEQGDLLMNLG